MVLDALFGSAKPRFFFDGDVEPAVRRLIREAREEIILVSPYNNFWINLKDDLHDARERGVAVYLIYRKGENLSEIKWLEKEGVTARAVERLHSKLYMNETTALVTSMNLLESSAINSKEICARFDGPDREALVEYAHRLAGRSEAHLAQQTARGGPKVPVRPTPAPPPRSAPKAAAASATGHCIRCGVGMPLNPEKPLCAKDYKSWNRFQDPDYEEEYCHLCGEEHDTSMAKPLCRRCWRAFVQG